MVPIFIVFTAQQISSSIYATDDVFSNDSTQVVTVSNVSAVRCIRDTAKIAYDVSPSNQIVISSIAINNVKINKKFIGSLNSHISHKKIDQIKWVNCPGSGPDGFIEVNFLSYFDGGLNVNIVKIYKNVKIDFGN